MPRRREIPFSVGLLVLMGLSTGLFGQEKADVDSDIRLLREQFQALQRQMDAMQQRHAAEIGALRQEIKALRGTVPASADAEDDGLARLQRVAFAEAARQQPQEGATEAGTTFRAGGLSLQALNPEISVVGDVIGLVRDQDGIRERSDVNVRCVGLHVESYLDPYSKLKLAVPVTESGAELGEAYMTRYGVLPNLNLTIGKFRQQFGVVNRWHKHGLDQVDFPLALRQIFGPGGLNQTGISLDWAMPAFLGSSQELTLQVTEGGNDRLFSGDTLGTPCTLVHYRNFRDLSQDTYCEIGLSGLAGWSDEWPVAGADEHDALSTRVFGLDFAVLWEPTGRMRYRNVEWRSELYWLDRDLLAPDGSGKDTLSAWGAYSYLQTKMNRTWDVGLRLDYYRPDEKHYADAPLAPLAYEDQAHRWQVGPYVTWHQSPFVKWRLEASHADGDGMSEAEDLVMLQLIFAAGPHKHERY